MRGTYAQVFMNCKTYYFSMKTKMQKAFSWRQPVPKFLKMLGL